MRMKLLLFLALCLMVMTAGAEERVEESVEERAEEMALVSLIQLIANPEKYHGKTVLVSGFMHLEFEGHALYLHRDDAMHFLSRNGIWVDWYDWEEGDGEEKLRSRNEFFDQFLLPHNDSYVVMEGVFNAKNTGHFGLWSGGIEQIKRVYRARIWEEKENNPVR
ncbi:MAG: hypothetical protein LBU11_01785 [Zoogloeaceae bacterium]|nr:hypothetical protein [Zoogloeaceae bacterium]